MEGTSSNSASQNGNHLHVQVSVTEAELRDCLSHFAFLFPRLVHDHDRRVRFLAVSALLAIAKRIPKVRMGFNQFSKGF